MRNIRLTILILILLSSYAMAQVKVYVRVQQDIYAGEQFQMQVIAENSQSAAELNPAELKDFNASFRGSSVGSSTSRIVINGRVVQDKSEYVSSWNLRVDRPGTYTIPALTVTVDGKEYKTEPVNFQAISPETSENLELEARVSTTECYLGQPIALSIKWYLSAKVNGFDFSIPDIMNEELFGSGNLPPEDTRQNQKIEGTSIGDIYITQTEITRKGRQALLVSFNKYIVPQKSGTITIDPISVVCQLETGRQSNGFYYSPTYKRFMAKADPITLNVKPLPTENRPADFYGLVGRSFFVMTELVNPPSEVSVGTPLTLRITISGNGNMFDEVKIPDMTFMASDFKIPADHASGEFTGDALVYTQTIRPLRSSADGLVEVPSISIPYFNYQTGKYDRAESAAIPLNIAGARKLVAADVANTSQANIVNSSTELNKIEHKIAANHYGSELLKNTSFNAGQWLKTPGAMAAILSPVVLVFFALVIARKTAVNPEAARERIAGRACKKAIANINKLSATDKNSYVSSINDCLRQYIGDKFALVV